MPSTQSDPKPMASTSDDKNLTKRKSTSNHTPPTAPSTSTSKKSPPRQTTNQKTQITLKTISEQKRQTKLTSPTVPHGTTSTAINRKIKQEKLDAATTTPSNDKNPIVLSSPEEDELYSKDVYTDTPDDQLQRSSTTLKNTTSATKGSNTANSVTPHSQHPPTHQTAGHSGCTLTSQGRGGRTGARLLPPPKLREAIKNLPTNPKTPINLTNEFNQESITNKSPQSNEVALTPHVGGNDSQSNAENQVTSQTPKKIER